MILFLVICLAAATLACALESRAGLQGSWEAYEGTELVYQIPEVPRAVLLVAHGCSHSATDWWPKSKKCPKCIGLPVEVNIVSEGLRRNFIVLAMSSTNRNHKCWTPQDIKPVTKAINHLYERYLNLDYSAPLYLLGASSGGTFVGQFASGNPELLPKVRAVCVQISNVHKPLHVPVLFNLMEKDIDLITMVRAKKQTQYKGGFKILISPTLPVTAAFFHEHGAVQTAALSESVFRALLKGGFLNKDTLQLAEDPRHSQWRKVLQHIPQSTCTNYDHVFSSFHHSLTGGRATVSAGLARSRFQRHQRSAEPRLGRPRDHRPASHGGNLCCVLMSFNSLLYHIGTFSTTLRRRSIFSKQHLRHPPSSPPSR